MNLITGRTGTDHVLARHDAMIHRTLLGNGDYVINYGSNMSYSPHDANHIYINDGALIMQGRLCEIIERENVEVEVCTASNLKRKAVIVAEYTINATGIEDVNIVVINGAESSNTYIEPTIPYKNGDIDSGETHQMPLYEVLIDGFAISRANALFRLLDPSPMTTAMTYATEFVTNLHEEVDREVTDMKERAAGVIPVIIASEREPEPEDGEDGEFWVVYTIEE